MSLEALKPLLERTLVLVAHPDDEAIICGGLLQQMRDPLVAFATDGAPADEYFWKNWGSREAYIAIRKEEAQCALAAVGANRVAFLADDSPQLMDQALFQNLATGFTALDRVAEDFQPNAILTLAYEGGHPDHDACSLLSCELGRRRSIPVWEAPLYHRSREETGVYQRFIQEKHEVAEYSVTGDELARKQQMLACYKSQFSALPSFEIKRERFRVQAQYDYTRPPHPGRLNYEVWQWQMAGTQVSREFAAFLAANSPLRTGAE